MDAIVINLHDIAERTPDQRVQAFFERYNYATVEAHLWEIFRVCGLNVPVPEYGPKLRETVALFDELISLVWAVEKLREQQEPSKCVICGRGDKGERVTGR
jgi:hypothetical protein